MIPESILPTLRGTCRTLQIIVLALATGVSVFAIVAIVQTNGKLAWEFPPTRIEDAVFLLIGLLMAPGSFVAPALLAANSSRSSNPELSSSDDPRTYLAHQAAGSVQTRTIIGCALLEGGAFANLIAVFSRGYGPSQIIAGMLMSMIVLRFPTWNRYLDRIEAAMRRMEEGEPVKERRQ